MTNFVTKIVCQFKSKFESHIWRPCFWLYFFTYHDSSASSTLIIILWFYFSFFSRFRLFFLKIKLSWKSKKKKKLKKKVLIISVMRWWMRRSCPNRKNSAFFFDLGPVEPENRNFVCLLIFHFFIIFLWSDMRRS